MIFNLKNSLYIGLWLLIFFNLTACVSTQSLQRASDRLDHLWTAENAEILQRHGMRVIELSPEQALPIVKKAIEQIGFKVATVDAEKGMVYSERVLKDEDINREVRRIEEPRLQKIFIEEIGSLGKHIKLGGKGLKLVANFAIKKVESGTEVSLKKIWSEDLDAAKRSFTISEQIAPAALKGGLYEFWLALDEELKLIEMKGAAGIRAKRPPSEWVIPASL